MRQRTLPKRTLATRMQQSRCAPHVRSRFATRMHQGRCDPRVRSRLATRMQQGRCAPCVRSRFATRMQQGRCAPRVRSRSAARMRAGVAAPLAYARAPRHGCEPEPLQPSRTLATRMLPKNARMPRRQSRCAPAYVGDADASEECTHAAPAESIRSGVRRRRGCFRRMHACRAGRVDALQRTSATRMLPKNARMPRSRVASCKLSFDAAEPRALDGPSLARRRAPSPLIPSPIYGIIYEFSDFWAQFWTIFKSTRPPSKS
jgi:hypothetical protein